MTEFIVNTILVFGGSWVVVTKCKEIILLADTDSMVINIFSRTLLWGACAVSVLGLLYIYVDIYIYPLSLFK